MSQIVIYFLGSSLVLSIHIYVVLTLSMAWKRMLLYIKKCQSHCIILHITFILFYLISQTGLLTYLYDLWYISGRLIFHFWTMNVIYLYECSISGRWVISICTSVTYLDDGGYISGRVLHIWATEVTYLDGCYISGRLQICTSHIMHSQCKI